MLIFSMFSSHCWRNHSSLTIEKSLWNKRNTKLSLGSEMRKLMKYWHISNFHSPRQRTLPWPVNKALAWPGIALNMDGSKNLVRCGTLVPHRTQSVAALCSHTQSVCPSQGGQEEDKWDCRNENMTPCC